MKAPLEKLPPHPIRRTALLFVLAGAVLLGASLLRGFTWSSLGLSVGAVVAILLGVFSLRQGKVAQLLNLAIDRRTRGHIDESEELLRAIPPFDRRGQPRRAMELQHAMNALLRDDPRSAFAYATSAIEGRLGLLARDQERVQVDHARGVRAMAAAQLDDATAVIADRAAARESPLVMPEALARITLAEAVVLSRANERDKLGALLAGERRLLLEFTTPRDRALVRALQRMLCAPASSAYRVAAPRVDGAEETELGSWIAKVAPAAAAFAPTGASVATSASVLRTTEGIAAADRRPLPKGRRRAPRALFLWAILIGTFLAVCWQLLAPPHPDLPAPMPPPEEAPFPTVAVSAIFFVVFLVFFMIVNRRSLLKVTEAMRLLSLPDLGRAEQAFTALTKSRFPIVAAHAHLQLAALSARRAAFAESLAHCEQGLARIGKNAIAGQNLGPQLLAGRAFALAALSRDDQASAELAALATEHPAYGLLASTQLVVRTMQAVKRGDLAAAREVVSQRTMDMPLDVKVEALLDTLVATGTERADRSEVERLRGELRTDAELHAWMEQVWPDAGRELERAASREGGTR